MICGERVGAPFSGAGKSVSPTRDVNTSGHEGMNAIVEKEGQAEEDAEERQSEEEDEQEKGEHRILRKPA